MKKIAILQSNYIPWKGYFDMINMVDEFIVYDHVQYTKNDWRNRNKIKTKEGTKWLTIPVKQDYSDQRINETKIADLKWNRKHWESIKSNYSKAGCFKEYKGIFEELYLQCSDHNLSSINIKFIEVVNSLLNITTTIRNDGEFDLTGNDKSEKLIGIIKQCKASIYLSGSSAKNYLNENIFKQEGITIMWMDYSGYNEYRQLFPPFAHDVSILDLIFNEGRDAKNYMKSFSV